MTDTPPNINRTVDIYVDNDHGHWSATLDEGNDVVIRHRMRGYRGAEWSGPSKDDVPWMTTAEARAFARELLALCDFAEETWP